MKTIPYDHIYPINCGYLVTPINNIVLSTITGWDDKHDDHEWQWPEYAMTNVSVLPEFLGQLADAGIAFGWEYMCTEDFSYYAYNYPTQESKNNLICYCSHGKKGLPRLTNKLRKQLEVESSINELLLRLGIKPHGTT